MAKGVYLSNTSALIEGKSAYWTVETRNNTLGKKEVRLVNVATGKSLKIADSEWFCNEDFQAVKDLVSSSSSELLANVLKNGTQQFGYKKDGFEITSTDLSTEDVYAATFDAIAVPDVVFPGDSENDPAEDYGNKKTFEMSIGAQVWNKNKGQWEGFKAYNPLKGNEFDGALKAEFTDGGMMLKNAAGKYIVLTEETWGTLSGELESNTKGYKFAALTKKDFDKNFANGVLKDDSKILAYTFQITQPSTVDGEPLEVVAIGVDDVTKYELEVAVVDGTAYLTVGTDATPGTADYVASGEETKDNTFIRFGSSNKIDYAIFRDKLLNITCVEEGAKKVANPACEGEDFIPVAQVALNQPEGQWLYQGGATFMNRESGNTD